MGSGFKMMRRGKMRTGIRDVSALNILKVGTRPPSPSPLRTMTEATLPHR